MRSALPCLGAALLGAALALLPAGALASEDYPEEMRRQLALTAEPACTLCHRDDRGGFGTVRRPVGQALVRRGLQGGDLPSLESSLRSAERAGLDTDADGTPDIAELRAGTDPNSATSAPGADGPGVDVAGADIPLEPAYGCSAAGPSTPLALLAVAWLLRRRSGRPAP